MGTADLERLEGERLAADRRYNDALTAVDAAVVSGADWAAVPELHIDDRDLAPPPLTGGMLPAPSWWRSGRWLRRVWEMLTPVFDRQREINARVAEALNAAAERDCTLHETLTRLTAQLRERGTRFEQFESALITYLQQITAFVDTKQRLVATMVTSKDAVQEDALRAVAEMRAQIAVLQRTVQFLTRDESPLPAVAAQADASRGPSAGAALRPVDRARYVGFEDQFRGTEAATREKLAAYVPIFADTHDVVDLGCGRGEFLALLREHGIAARGVDANDEMAALARQRGLDVVRGDGLAYLQALPDGSIGGLFAAQVVEHLPPAYLLQLLDAAQQKLRAGAPVVLETINPACWLAFFSSYLRDFTHVTPVHPDTLQFLMRASGFERVAIQYSAPVPDAVKMKPIHLPADVLASSDAAAHALAKAAHVVNANAAILNNLLFSYFDYAAVGYRS